jgi:hypothetical protein
MDTRGVREKTVTIPSLFHHSITMRATDKDMLVFFDK